MVMHFLYLISLENYKMYKCLALLGEYKRLGTMLL